VGLEAVSGPCDAGYYCTLTSDRPDPNGDPIGDICPFGYYCPQGTGVPQACSDGYFTNATGNTDVSDCELCTPGNLLLVFRSD